MQYIWLRYKTGAVTESMRLRVTRETSEPETTRIEQTGLRGIEYSHLTAKRRVWSIVISADELIYVSKWDFINSFWTAARWWIAEDESTDVPVDAAFVEVVIPQGKLPVEYLNNHEQLRQVAFDVRQKKSDVLT
jgi:hypothetical protein